MNWIDTYQIGGQPQPDETDQQILQMIAQALQQGKQPEEIMRILVQGGIPQEEAQQLIQTVMGSMQGQQPMQQSQEQPMMQSGGMSTQDFVNYVLFNSQGGFNGTQKKPANTQGKGQVGGMDQMQAQPQGGEEEQIMQMIVQALQNGKSPEEILAALVEAGVPQEQAQQMIQQVMQQSQGGQEEMMQGGGKKKCQTGGNLQSAMGYNYDSPFKNAPYLDIYTPKKVIDMSKTPIDLHLKGNNTNVVLPKFSGKYKVEDQVIRETPYGNFNRTDMNFSTPYEVKPQQAGGDLYLSDILPKKDKMEREDMLRNKMIEYFKTLSPEQLEKRFKEMNGEMVNISSDKYSPISKSNVPFVQEAYAQVDPVQMVPKTRSTRYQAGGEEMEQSQIDPKVIINKWFEAKRMSREDMDKFLLSYQQLPEDQKQQLLQTMAQELDPQVMATGGLYQNGGALTSSSTGDTLTRTSTYMLPDYSASNVGTNPVPKPKSSTVRAAQVVSKPTKEDPSNQLFKVQAALQKKGYLKEDTFEPGTFDNATVKALSTFQVKNRIANSIKEDDKYYYGDLKVGKNTAVALGLGENFRFIPTENLADEEGRKSLSLVSQKAYTKGTPPPKGTTSPTNPISVANKPAASSTRPTGNVQTPVKSYTQKDLMDVGSNNYRINTLKKLAETQALANIEAGKRNEKPASMTIPFNTLKEERDFYQKILKENTEKMKNSLLLEDDDYDNMVQLGNPGGFAMLGAYKFVSGQDTPYSYLRRKYDKETADKLYKQFENKRFFKYTSKSEQEVSKKKVEPVVTKPVASTPPKKIESSIEGLANDVSWAASGIYDAGKQLGSNFVKNFSRPNTPSTPLVKKSTPAKTMQSNLSMTPGKPDTVYKEVVKMIPPPKKFALDKDLRSVAEDVYYSFNVNAGKEFISKLLVDAGYTPIDVEKILKYRKEIWENQVKNGFGNSRPTFDSKGNEVIIPTKGK